MGARPARGQARGKRGAQLRRGAGAHQQRNGFRGARIPEPEHGSAADDSPSDSSDKLDQSDREVLSADDDDDEDEEEDEEVTPALRQSYATLLQALNVDRATDEPPRKKRRTVPDTAGVKRIENDAHTTAEQADLPKHKSVAVGADAWEDREVELANDAQAESDSEAEHSQNSEDEPVASQDPFESHFVSIAEETLKNIVAQQVQKQVKHTLLGENLQKQLVYCDATSSQVHNPQLSDRLHIKARLRRPGSVLIDSLPAEQKDLFEEITNYRDVQFGWRTIENASDLREIACLHGLNHVFKTRDRVLKNNTRLNQHDGDDDLDLRDQGFTRPKVLFIVPTKQACSRFVESIARLSEAEQQENKARFWETYSQEDDETWENKPEDFRELFGGNHEEDFRVGLKFTRKTIKYFSGFYNSDIIFGSALGLMRTITTGGGGSKDKKKGHDADFLSSIEVVVIDHAAAIQMQNFQHLEYVLGQLNQIPKDSRGCDFGRVRNWYLDGHAKQIRQTILFTPYHTPELNSLFSNHASNVAGLAKYTPTYRGAMLNLPPFLRAHTVVPQTFLRFESPDVSSDSDARFKFFTTTLLPHLLRHRDRQVKTNDNNSGVLIFVPTYFDFVRLRNFLATSNETASLSFGSVSEYTSPRDTARARSHFATGRHRVLVYSERAHHHFRYRIRGVRRLIFYGVPDNPVFWGEIVGLLGLGRDAADVDEIVGRSGGVGGGDSTNNSRNSGVKNGVVRALFSRWDVLKLERIVGTERVRRLIHDRGGDTFEFL